MVLPQVVSLNIGCGGTKKYPLKGLGDVNCDIQKPEKCVSGFVLCDALSLPFKNNSFSEVFAYHIIEHLKKPAIFLAECGRVASGRVYIITPNLYSQSSYGDLEHVLHFR